MRTGFTILEVMIAAMIAGVVGAALLQMNSNNLIFFDKLKRLSFTTEELSVAGMHADKRYTHSHKSLYDMIEGVYDVQNDDFRKYLKNEKYNYAETLVDIITIGDEAAEVDDENGAQDGEDDTPGTMIIQFELIKVSIKEKEKHGALLIARPL